jgi:hypothetical protein
MTALFKKLNLKEQNPVYIINSPVSFKAEMDNIKQSVNVINDLSKADEIMFILSFVTKQEELDGVIPVIAEKLKGDGVVWFAYPKQSSKKIKCEINRDNGWDILGEYGFEAVRQVAIDEDWSAVRFRKVEYIKTMKRKDGAMTEEGKKKAGLN